VKSRLVIQVEHGLANRLRAYACAAVIAQCTARDLILVWRPDHHCNCLFSDLFENGPTVVEKIPPLNFSRFYNYMDEPETTQFGKTLDIPPTGDIFIRSAHWLHHSQVTWPSVIGNLNQLAPVEPVAAIIGSIDVSDLLGVAVRCQRGASYSHLSWESAENWSAEGHQKIDYWASQTRPQSFYRRMDTLLDRGLYEGFFLTGDIPEIYTAMSARYGERVKFNAQHYFDREKESIRKALADLILLSKTSLILGSPYSAYSILAAQMGANKLELAGVHF
jgi:hypothetical protein